MQESVIPADTKLQRALENGRKGRLGKVAPVPAEPELPAASPSARESAPEEVLPSRARGSLGLSGSRAPAGHEASLIEA
jgi:hypothetical protein